MLVADRVLHLDSHVPSWRAERCTIAVLPDTRADLASTQPAMPAPPWFVRPLPRHVSQMGGPVECIRQMRPRSQPPIVGAVRFVQVPGTASHCVHSALQTPGVSLLSHRHPPFSVRFERTYFHCISISKQRTCINDTGVMVRRCGGSIPQCTTLRSQRSAVHGAGACVQGGGGRAVTGTESGGVGRRTVGQGGRSASAPDCVHSRGQGGQGGKGTKKKAARSGRPGRTIGAGVNNQGEWFGGLMRPYVPCRSWFRRPPFRRPFSAS